MSTPDTPKTQGLVVIARYSQVYEAQVAQSYLAAHGIETFIHDQFIVGINWLYSNALGGVKLVVRAEQAKLALQLLNVPDVRLVDTAEDAPSAPRRRRLSQLITIFFILQIIFIMIIYLYN